MSDHSGLFGIAPARAPVRRKMHIGKTITPKTITRHENRRYRVRLIDLHMVCAEVDLSVPVSGLVDIGLARLAAFTMLVSYRFTASKPGRT